MSLTKKNLLMYCIVIFVLPLVILLVLEVVWVIIYYTTGSKYFENRSESYNRKSIPLAMEVRKEFKSGGSVSKDAKPKKVAVFGGSSAAGYASPTSFAKLLSNNDLSGKNLEVHNYARPGSPFVGFQAEMLKAVMSDYDVLVVYAGHNEIWQQIYFRASKSFWPITLPTGNTVSSGSSRYDMLEQRIRCVSAQKCDPVLEGLSWIVDKSRFYWFVDRLIIIVNNFLLTLDIYNALILFIDNEVVKPIKKSYEQAPRFFYERTFITPVERQQLVDQYKETIQEIVGRLRDNQVLILSTVLANDMFPPLAEVITNKSAVEVSLYEDAAKKSYSSLVAGDYFALQEISQRLPSGAHKTYLEAMACLHEKGFKISESDECLAVAKEARRLDKFPVRVVPEINSFIRSYNNEHVIVVDPEKIIEETPESLEDYHSYFVDFQHPSAKGHFVISDAILAGLFSDYQSPRSAAIVDDCGNITFGSESPRPSIESDPKLQTIGFSINIDWLFRYILEQPSSYPYEFFIERASKAQDFCEKIPH